MGVRGRATYFTKRHIVPFLVWLVGIFAWAEFLAKPFVAQATKDGGNWPSAIADLFKLTPAAFGWPLSGYLFLTITLIASIASVIFVLRPLGYIIHYLEISEEPLSIVHSEYQLTFNSDRSVCNSDRIQYLHANCPDVNAYHYRMAPFYGTIQIKEIKSDINGRVITRSREDHSKGNIKEFIEVFSDPLPLSFLITYLPDRFVFWTHKNWGWFKSKIVRRVVNTIEKDEYDKGSPTFEIEARYPVSGLKITLRFPEANSPQDSDIIGYFTDEGALRHLQIYSRLNSGFREFSVEFGRLHYGQKLRISWPPN
jgi:hypothetical protein